MKKIRSRSRVDARVRIPGSKSVTHRALITSAFAQGESVLDAFLACEDTLYTLEALRSLGAPIAIEGEKAIVQGKGGHFPLPSFREEIFLGNSGTSFRLLLSVVSLARGEYMLTGTPRMNQRPIGDLVTALNRLGARVSCPEREGYPPVLIEGRGIRGGKVDIPGDKSSQYISSLLLAGPYAEKDTEIQVKGDLVSKPYVDVTLDVMKAFGVPVFRDGYRYFSVSGGQTYRPCRFVIDGDVSSASYFWAAAAVTGGKVVTENIHPFSTRQGDIALLDTLKEMGCSVEREESRVMVTGGSLKSMDLDMGTMPDMVPTLAAVALFAEGKTVIRNVPHLRIKESDRLRAVALEWEKLGAHVEELADGLIIHGGHPIQGTVVDPHNDHRLAMSLAVVGLKVPGIRIQNEDCVKKSFPSFWEVWDSL
jgi:3-phosphoshikimate 1-carboxyvinyltransferase